MGYSKSVYDRADRILNERRLDAEKKADRVRNAFYEKYPRAKEIENELSHTFTGIARAMLSGQGESIEEIKNKGSR